MTEIPAHLMKRAEEARRKAALSRASGQEASPSTSPNESVIPDHLLERAKAVREQADRSVGPFYSPPPSAPPASEWKLDDIDPTAVESVSLFPGREQRPGGSNGPWLAVGVILILIIAVGAVLLLRGGGGEPKVVGDEPFVGTTEARNCSETASVKDSAGRTYTVKVCVNEGS